MNKLIIIMILSLAIISGCQTSNTATPENIVVVNTQKCVSTWSCQDWTACISNSQTRYCSDTNNCDEPSNVPDMKRSCGTTSTVESGVTELVSGQNTLKVGEKVSFNSKPITLVKTTNSQTSRSATININTFLKTINTGDTVGTSGISIRLISITDDSAVVDIKLD